jgi:hypothetical protein
MARDEKHYQPRQEASATDDVCCITRMDQQA